MWIGDFVRCHSVLQVLKNRDPKRAVDMLATSLTAPLVDYMPGVRKAIVVDLPRGRLAFKHQWALAERLRAERYGTVLIMPRTWKAALAPALAGIPRRVGFVGEWRFGLINDLRRGERAMPRMIDQCASLALPANATRPVDWPLPELRVSPADVSAFRAARAHSSAGRTVVALAPGAVGPSKRWPEESFAALAQKLAQHDGCDIWLIGGPNERDAAARIAFGHERILDLTGNDLRNAILALAASDAAVSNDSGLLHVAAALGTRSIGIFGPTSAWHWAPLNPLAATIETATDVPCRPCHKPVCRMIHHRCMRDIGVERVFASVRHALHGSGLEAAQ